EETTRLPGHAGTERVVAEAAHRRIDLDPFGDPAVGNRHERELGEAFGYVERAVRRVRRVAGGVARRSHRIGIEATGLAPIVDADAHGGESAPGGFEQQAARGAENGLLLVEAARDAGVGEITRHLRRDRSEAGQQVERHATRWARRSGGAAVGAA